MGDLIIFLIWFNYKLGIIFKKGISSFFKLKKKASHDCLEKIKIIKLKKSWKLYTIKSRTINIKFFMIKLYSIIRLSSQFIYKSVDILVIWDWKFKSLEIHLKRLKTTPSILKRSNKCQTLKQKVIAIWWSNIDLLTVSCVPWTFIN